jgi:hypothetical protein
MEHMLADRSLLPHERAAHNVLGTKDFCVNTAHKIRSVMSAARSTDQQSAHGTKHAMEHILADRSLLPPERAAHIALGAEDFCVDTLAHTIRYTEDSIGGVGGDSHPLLPTPPR